MGVVFVLLLVLAVSCIGLDTARNRRPGASLTRVIAEVGRRPTDWQLVAAGLGFVSTAFATTVTPWAALGGLAVLAFLGEFLHRSRPRRAPVPMPRDVLATPEPASNVKLL
ncbi:MAG: hypothetical protein ABR549_10605 [Mycobacteriales bacterium]